MSTHHDSVDSLSLQDCFGGNGGHALPADELSFYGDDVTADFPTPEEEAAMEANYRARLAAPEGYTDQPCTACGDAMLFPAGGVAVCVRCLTDAAATRYGVSVASARGGKFEGLVRCPGKPRPVSAGKFRDEAEAWRQAGRLAREFAADEVRGGKVA